jgi:alpha-glucosidase
MRIAWCSINIRFSASRSKNMDLLTIKLGLFLVMQTLFGRKRIPAIWKRLGSVGEIALAASCDSVSICTKHAEIIIRAFDPLIFHVSVRSENDPVYVSCSVEDRPLRRLRVTKEDHIVSISTDTDENALAVEVNERDSTLRFMLNGRVLHSESLSAGFSGRWVSCTKEHEEPEYLLGMGQKTGSLFKNKKSLVMWNNDNPRINEHSDPLYQSCPFIISMRVSDGTSHGTFYDNTYYSMFKCGGLKKKKATSYYAHGGPLSYYVFGGPSLKQVVEQFTFCTGRYELPPLWALGHHHSRWESNESAERLLGIAKEMRSRNVPCDVMHIDIGHMEGFRCFTWDKKSFPDPRGFIEAMHKEGFKVVIISDPGIKKDTSWDVYTRGVEQGHFCKDRKGIVYHAPVWPGESAFPDYTSPEVREWWGNLYKGNIEMGVDGFWNDMNEPSLFTSVRTLPSYIQHKGGCELPQMKHDRVHNIYGLLMVRATREGIQRLRPEVRPFVFTRSSFAGIQRYASSWTGDNTSNWEHLELSIPMLFNMGLSGQTMTGPDIGGFWGDSNGELLARWIEAGVLYPFSRNHTSAGTALQEVWRFGKETEDVSKKYLALRYSLLPYIYTCFRESALTGIPFMRPLFFEFPHDPHARELPYCETEYMGGPSFLVAPVLSPGTSARKVYFPQGADWLDYSTGDKFLGGTEHTVSAPFDKLPIYVRSGSAIPLIEKCISVPQSLIKQLVIKVYPSRSISGNLYIDDGESYAYKNGDFSFLKINGTSWEEEASFSIERIEGKLDPILYKYPSLSMRIHKKSLPRRATNALVNGKPVSFTMESTESGDEWVILEDCAPDLPVNVVLKMQK